MTDSDVKARRNELTESVPDFKDMFAFVYGAMRWQAFEVGIVLNVFDHLTLPISAGDLARSAAYHPANTEALLDSLAAMNLLTKRDGLYCNTPAATCFLVSGKSTYLGEILRDQANMCQLSGSLITEMIKKGPAARQQENEDPPDYPTNMARHYANYLRSGISQIYLNIIDDHPVCKKSGKMLDLGGGPGITAIALAAKYHEMHCVVFDQSTVAEVAREMVQYYALSDRVSVMAGDYTTDSIGDGYDLVLAAFTLNYSRNRLDRLLTRIRNAMNPGGVFIAIGDGLTCERTRPADYIVGMLPLSLSGWDIGFERGEVAATMKKVGFKKPRSFVLDSPIGPMDIDIVEK